MSEWRKSSYSGYNGNCVEVAWRRSSHCEGGACAEVAQDGDQVRVRDSKDPDGPVLEFSTQEWRAFVRRLMTDHAAAQRSETRAPLP